MGLLGLLAIVLLMDGVILVAEGCAGAHLGTKRVKLIVLGGAAILAAAHLVKKFVLGH